MGMILRRRRNRDSRGGIVTRADIQPCVSEHPTWTLPSATHERLEWGAALSQNWLTVVCCVCGASSAERRFWCKHLQSNPDALVEAVLYNDLKKTLNLLQQPTSKVNDPGEDGQTVLHVATAAGNVNIVKMLLKYGAQVNLASKVSAKFAVRNPKPFSRASRVALGRDGVAVEAGVVVL